MIYLCLASDSSAVDLLFSSKLQLHCSNNKAGIIIECKRYSFMYISILINITFNLRNPKHKQILYSGTELTKVTLTHSDTTFLNTEVQISVFLYKSRGLILRPAYK